MKVPAGSPHSTRMRLRNALLVGSLAFGAAGCNGCLLLPNITLLENNCESFPVPLESMAVVGEPVTFDLAIFTRCARSAPSATQAAVTVKGPDGSDVPHTLGTLEHNDPYANSIDVTFTPDRVGTYTITAEFEPKLGLVTYAVQAAAKRMGAPEQTIPWDGPTDCVGFTFTSKGTLSCMRHVPDNSSTPLAGNEVVTNRGQKLQGLGFVARGDVLWRINADQGMRVIERLVDDGTGFVRTHQSVNATAAGPMAIVEDDAWLTGSDTTLLRAHPEPDGTLTVTTVPRPGIGAQGLGGNARGLLIWWSDNPVTPRPQMTFVTPAGVGESKAMTGGEFVYKLIGFDEEVMWADFQYWTKEDAINRRSIAAFSAAGTPLAPVVEVRAEYAQFTDIKDADPAFAFFPPKVAVRRDPAPYGKPPTQPFAVPRLEKGAIVLETFDVGPGFEQIRSATRTHVFAIATDGKFVKVIDR